VTEVASVIVVSDTSPIVNLAVVGRLDLLQLRPVLYLPK
jgi:hypothetical protein